MSCFRVNLCFYLDSTTCSESGSLCHTAQVVSFMISWNLSLVCSVICLPPNSIALNKKGTIDVPLIYPSFVIMTQSLSQNTDEMPLNNKLRAISSNKKATSLETPRVCPSFHACGAAANNCDYSHKACLQLYDSAQLTHFKHNSKNPRLDDTAQIVNTDS